MGSGGSKHHEGPCGAAIASLNLSTADVPTLRATFHTLSTALTPVNLCDAIGGDATGDGNCAVDVQGWVNELHGVKDGGQLCEEVVGGKMGGRSVCVIRVDGGPGKDAGAEEKRSACGVVGGEWEEGEGGWECVWDAC